MIDCADTIVVDDVVAEHGKIIMSDQFRGKIRGCGEGRVGEQL